MPELADIPGVAELWDLTLGDPDVGVALVDGSVDASHPCFAGADLVVVEPTWLPPFEETDIRREHGTWVASVLFGQHGGPVPGLAPRCTGIVVPVLRGDIAEVDPLNVARAIEAATDAGARIILVELCYPSRSGDVDDLLHAAISRATEAGALVVAGAGNEYGACSCFPAAVPEVLAVGACDDDGRVYRFSNWGPEYAGHGLVAPGGNLLGATPGGGTVRHHGTSCSGPVAAGVAALLLSLQRRLGVPADTRAVRDALLRSARQCGPEQVGDRPERCIDGMLDVPGATRLVLDDVRARAGAQVSVGAAAAAGRPPSSPDGVVTAAVAPAAPAAPRLVYVLGTLGYDFGTEARRDSFKQLMAPVAVDGTTVPANPYDARQMVGHLTTHPSETRALTWTLNLELTPVYAIEPTGPYAADIYTLLTTLLSGETAGEDHDDYIERVSIPARLTDRTVKLFSGQVIPVIEVEHTRGLYGWKINTLLDAATHAAHTDTTNTTDTDLHASLREFLTRVYYDLRNLGATSRDRALNYAATNAFQAAHTFADAVAAGMALDTITVDKSPFCRIDSDCWDVKLRFFDPENSRRARRVFRFTIDVSDILPVTLGEVRSWRE